MWHKGIFRTGHLGAGRLEAFSDGVLAIVITLLILDVKVPEGIADEPAIWQALISALPRVAAWAVSFFFVLVFWVNHHYFVASLKAVDRGLLLLNGLFLFFVSTTPFPTGLVGQYPGLAPPLALLSATMLATSLSFSVMRIYATYHAVLIREQPSKRQLKLAMIQSVTAPALYAVAFVLAFVWAPGAVVVQILVALMFLLRSPSHSASKRDIAA